MVEGIDFQAWTEPYFPVRKDDMRVTVFLPVKDEGSCRERASLLLLTGISTQVYRKRIPHESPSCLPTTTISHQPLLQGYTRP